jgi:hypothetical protein
MSYFRQNSSWKPTKRKYQYLENIEGKEEISPGNEAGKAQILSRRVFYRVGNGNVAGQNKNVVQSEKEAFEMKERFDRTHHEKVKVYRITEEEIG